MIEHLEEEGFLGAGQGDPLVEGTVAGPGREEAVEALAEPPPIGRGGLLAISPQRAIVVPESAEETGQEGLMADQTGGELLEEPAFVDPAEGVDLGEALERARIIGQQRPEDRPGG